MKCTRCGLTPEGIEARGWRYWIVEEIFSECATAKEIEAFVERHFRLAGMLKRGRKKNAKKAY